MITVFNLILVTISTGTHFYLFIFIKINDKKFLLVQINFFLCLEKRIDDKENIVIDPVLKKDKIDLICLMMEDKIDLIFLVIIMIKKQL